MTAIQESFLDYLTQIDIIPVVSLIISAIALGLNWLNRRNQKSAQIITEIFPREDGVFVSFRNVGDRAAYNCKLSIEPLSLYQAISYLPVIAPQRSYEVFLCSYGDIPPEEIRITISYRDPVHKIKPAISAVSFETSRLGEYRILFNKDTDSFLVEK